MIIDFIKDTVYRVQVQIRIKHKLLISFFLVIFIPAFVLSTVYYNWAYGLLKKHAIATSDNVLRQASLLLDFRMNSVNNIFVHFINDLELLKRVDPTKRTYTSDDEKEDFAFLNNYIYNMEKVSNIYKIRLYMQSSSIYTKPRNRIFNINEIINTDLYRKTLEANGKIYITDPYVQRYSDGTEEKIISASRIIRSTSNYDNIIAILVVDITTSELESIIGGGNYLDKGIVLLLDSKGHIIVSVDRTGHSLDADTLDEDIKNLPDSGVINLNGTTINVVSSHVESSSWDLRSLLPISQLMEGINTVRVQVFSFALVICCMVSIAAYYISNSITSRLKKMVETMHIVQTGNMDAKIFIDSNDEIGEAMFSFNHMVNQVKRLMQEIQEVGEMARASELKALQHQFNPHFLYNSMDMIFWMAKNHNNDDICNAITALASFYKLCLSEGNEMIPVKDELNHVKLYVDLQNMRYGNKILLQLEISDEVYEYNVIKLILQPIVENGILHGIMKKEDKLGIIRITCLKEGNDIVFLVADNGIGITIGSINSLLVGSPQQDNKRCGYGIRNVNERIKMKYGREYGLSYTNQPGGGTLVKIKIPAVVSK